MANRVIIGKRGSDYGLFVSKSGDDVTTTTNPLGFDSRAVESFIVHSYGEGILVPDVQHRTTGAQLTYTYDGATYSTRGSAASSAALTAARSCAGPP